MDKNKILNNYMKAIYDNIDELRKQYPKARSEDILQMEKGFRYCATKSSEWIEELLEGIEIYGDTPAANIHPLGEHIDKTTSHTNSLSEPIKKKKSFLQLGAEAFSDMGKDIFRANQMSMRSEAGKEDKKKEEK